MRGRDLSDFEWVRLGCSRDDYRPVLTGVKVEESGALVATDGHRLHVARNAHTALTPGIVRPGTMEPIDSEYPNWGAVIYEGGHRFCLDRENLRKAVALARACAAAGRDWPTSQVPLLGWPAEKGTLWTHAPFVLDAIRALRKDEVEVNVRMKGPFDPLILEFPGGRCAVVMGVRVASLDAVPDMFKIDRLLESQTVSRELAS